MEKVAGFILRLLVLHACRICYHLPQIRIALAQIEDLSKGYSSLFILLMGGEPCSRAQ